MKTTKIQRLLKQQDIEAWLLYDFRGLNPIAQRVTALEGRKITRRWFCCLPQQGSPTWLIQHIEQSHFQDVEGEHLVYGGWQELRSKLAQLLAGYRTVAMEYSPHIPYVSRVDGGTLELVKSTGVDVVTSADLVQHVESKLSVEQFRGHQQSARQILLAKDSAFEWIGQQIKSGKTITEYQVQQRIMADFDRYNLVTDHPPIVAVNANSADPHYAPTVNRHQPIMEGDLILIDLWAKQTQHDAIFADTTWVGYVGQEVPEKYTRVFDVVRVARDRAINFIKQRMSDGRITCGFEVDDVVRGWIQKSGYGDFFTHRTGHNIGREVHGNGVNMDNFESKDERQLVEGICFSIEPGIYFSGDFGVRTEIDVFLAPPDQGGVVVSTAPVQTAVSPLL
mgnify:CR=1 FL=1